MGTTLFSLNVSSKEFFYESLRGLERLSAAQSCHGLRIFNPPFYVRFFFVFVLFALFCFTPLNLVCVPVFRHCYFSCQVWQCNRVLLIDL